MTQSRTKDAPTPDETAEASAPVLRITAKPRHGFRRCGQHHPAGPVEFPAGRFSAAEIAALKAEPNLVVEEL
ncbi:HI1506-related protein [Pannonibacter carbonis]|uniref:HI1506-related protein n=1 Tax=Pannonibacter carbonis TaxID=2067569 RepID=UPI000D0EF6E4|nr:HI1506-related protein [Pannonibacter carbonis]